MGSGPQSICKVLVFVKWLVFLFSVVSGRFRFLRMVCGRCLSW